MGGCLLSTISYFPYPSRVHERDRELACFPKTRLRGFTAACLKWACFRHFTPSLRSQMPLRRFLIFSRNLAPEALSEPLGKIPRGRGVSSLSAFCPGTYLFPRVGLPVSLSADDLCLTPLSGMFRLPLTFIPEHVNTSAGISDRISSPRALERILLRQLGGHGGRAVF